MYILVDNPQLAEAISTAFYSLTVPIEVENQTTKTWCGWIIHPSNGQAALAIPDDQYLRVHPNSNSEVFNDLIGHVITEAEAREITRILDICRQGGSAEEDIKFVPGNRIKIVDYLPQSLLDRVRSKEQLETEEWFPSE